MEMEKNKAYEILGLSPSATELEIKKAYRRLSLQYHPEKNNTLGGQSSKFKDLQEAYEFLLDELPINYKVNFGVSEEEIQGLNREIVENFAPKELKDLLDLEELAE